MSLQMLFGISDRWNVSRSQRCVASMREPKAGFRSSVLGRMSQGSALLNRLVLPTPSRREGKAIRYRYSIVNSSRTSAVNARNIYTSATRASHSLKCRTEIDTGVKTKEGVLFGQNGRRRCIVANSSGSWNHGSSNGSKRAEPIIEGGLSLVFQKLLDFQNSVKRQFGKLDGMWGRFIPMSLLFFMMAFVNTIIDSLKDSLVITAVGGGTQVLPYLSVYAVLPSSVLFLILYSWGTRYFSREKLFNIIVLGFMVFYGAFALAYPQHETLHLSVWADALVDKLPTGLGGFIGMIRNWTFTLFYCTAELWGDVVLSLLFWGLANETTSIEDAPILYPLFGVGANIAQTMAGRFLRLFSDAAGVHLSYTLQLQATVALCVVLGCLIVAMQSFISKTFPKNPKGSTAALQAKKKQSMQASSKDKYDDKGNDHARLDLEASVKGLNYCDIEYHDSSHISQSPKGSKLENQTLWNGDRQTSKEILNMSASEIEDRKQDADSTICGETVGKASMVLEKNSVPERKPDLRPQKKEKVSSLSLKEAWEFLRHSPQINCLAIMALAQGITTRLLEVTWKHYLHQLHTTPAAYAAFLGDTAMWTGIVTGCLMFSSPVLFDRWGWKGVASATPKFMLWFGVPFFIGCIAYNFFSQSALAMGAITLQALVIAGAILQVFSRGAKFSLFKPAEEMVYIGLDDESRTKGKAAIDVVGAQSGKSIGSVLQQVLLIISGGTVGGIVPLLAVFYTTMLYRWTFSVNDLAEHYDPAHIHRASIMGSLDEDEIQNSISADSPEMGMMDRAPNMS